MSTHDPVLARLHQASAAEREALRAVLGVRAEADIDVTLVRLRDAYEALIGARTSLRDGVTAAAIEAARRAGWRAPTIPDAVPVSRIEDYVLTAATFAIRQPEGSDARHVSAVARLAAEAALRGDVPPEPPIEDAGVTSLAAGAVFAVGGPGVALGWWLYDWVIGAKRRARLLDAAILLAHVRRRAAVEAELAAHSAEVA